MRARNSTKKGLGQEKQMTARTYPVAFHALRVLFAHRFADHAPDVHVRIVVHLLVVQRQVAVVDGVARVTQPPLALQQKENNNHHDPQSSAMMKTQIQPKKIPQSKPMNRPLDAVRVVFQKHSIVDVCEPDLVRNEVKPSKILAKLGRTDPSVGFPQLFGHHVVHFGVGEVARRRAVLELADVQVHLVHVGQPMKWEKTTTKRSIHVMGKQYNSI